jgi:hypothetical protein
MIFDLVMPMSWIRVAQWVDKTVMILATKNEKGVAGTGVSPESN